MKGFLHLTLLAACIPNKSCMRTNNRELARRLEFGEFVYDNSLNTEPSEVTHD